jgi:hypothetical protein
VAFTLVRVLRTLRDRTLDDRADRTVTLEEIDRQRDAVIDDALRAGLPDSELAPLREAARLPQE